MNLDDRSSTGYGSETIYGTHEDSHVVMSEKVQTLAGSIYQEFERMIARYDEDVVKTLMPLLVNVLECLDAAYQTNQVHDVDLELLREDNEQLVTQYEREKSARKHAEQKLLEAEDMAEGDRKELTGRLEAVDSIVRMLELKHKNSLDHASRLEERENELKKEYAKLHERYTELFKTHVDYMERTKLLLSTAGDRGEVRGRLGLNPMSRSSGPISIGFASLEGGICGAEHPGSIPDSPLSISSSPPSPTLGSELAAVQTMEQSGQTDPIRQHSQATSPATPVATVNSNMGKSQTKREQRSGNTLYQELSFPDTDNNLNEGEDTGDITGSWVHPGEYASSVNDNYFGMGKEVENLILENNELLATKNALNVVKDDLIVKVDELTGEQEILREEVANLSAARQKLREKVSQLEEDLRHLKEAMSSGASGGGGDGTNAEDEADVPLAQRKRFTRVEMARVLMERNQYKERFMELQDAVRWTEMVRASRVDSTMDKKNKQSIWKLFSNLFSTGDRPQRPLSSPHLGYLTANHSPMRHSRTQADFLETQVASEHAQYRRNTERREQFRQVRAHVRKEDGRTQAYGWSLPGKTSNAAGPGPSVSLASSGVPVPVPVFCRPVSEAEPGMSLVCAAGVDMTGGITPDGGCMVGASVFYGKLETKVEVPMSLADEISNAHSQHSPEVEEIDRHIQSTLDASCADRNLSSLIWICSSGHSNAIVMVIDAINPADILESFTVNDKHILCVASVPGATDGDYQEMTSRLTTQEENDKQSVSDGDIPTRIVQLVKTTSSSPLDSPIKEYGKGRVTEEDYLSDVEETTMTSKDVGSNPKVVPESGIESPPLAGSLQNDHNLSAEPGIDAFTQEEENARSSNGDDGENLIDDRKMSTVLATMWIGTKSGNLFVHSAVGNWGQCLARVKLNDAILSIVHCAARCIVALADGSVAVFSRLENGSWDFSQYHTVILGDPKCSVRCLTAVGCTVWCGYRNKVLILEPRTLEIVHTLEAHPRKESQVRQMAWLGEGVWVSIKMDSTLRLYHAHTYRHLQDVDIEPYVSKMLGTGKLGFSLVRITALLISAGRLWIGTSNGVVISVPLSEGSAVPSSVSTVTLRSGHGAVSRCSSSGGESVPYCSMAHAQLSFHGHREAVVFFVAVPGAGSTTPHNSQGSPTHNTNVGPAPTLVMSGGEGYIDFRIADSEMEDSVILANDDTADNRSEGATAAAALEKKNNKSHLIVWQVAMP